MRLQDIMNRSVETVAPTDSLVLANELMWRKRIHHLVVMDGQRVVGVISDTDLGGPNAQDIPDNRTVSDFMTPLLVTGEPTMTVDRAINIFRERHLHSLPVMDGETLVGIVTMTDIENLARRGTSNHRYEGESFGPYPPLNPNRGSGLIQ